MQKVYLLLRGNQQQGPFSLQELIQFDLKPADLIWIEGKSAGWYYPQEISELIPYVDTSKHTLPDMMPASPTTPLPSATPPIAQPKKIFVAMPAKSFIETAAPPSFYDRSSSYMPHSPEHNFDAPPKKETLLNNVSRSLDDVETDNTNWVYTSKEKKQKQNNRRRMVLASSLLIAVLLGFAAFYFFSETKKQSLPTTQETVIATSPVANDSLVADTHLMNASVQESTPTAVNAIAKKQTSKSKSAVVIKSLTPIITRADPEKKKKPATPENDITGKTSEEKILEKSNTQVSAANPVTVAKNSPTASTTPPVEKKKKLKEKIIDLFKKKEPVTNEESKSVEVEDGQRRSIHREANVDLSDQVRIYFTIPNNWMIGVKGGRISLVNKSNQTILKATIDVLYYNEDNDLLQTKTVSFGKIEAKESKTILIPDHSFTDHVEYKIISVQGATEPYARQ